MTRDRAAGALATLAGLAMVALAIWGVWSYIERHQFDAAKWRADPAEPCDSKGFRRPMIGDLRKHHLHEGMTKADVLQLLGPPDNTWDSTHRTKGWDYDAGIPGIGGSDCHVLYVGFDEHGRLVEWFE